MYDHRKLKGKQIKVRVFKKKIKGRSIVPKETQRYTKLDEQ
jgi:hypothetical protein